MKTIYFLIHYLMFVVLIIVTAYAPIGVMAAEVENDPDCKQLTWGPYDPKPGHPTAAERQVFIDKISTIAKKAEERFKVPAAAIAAMAMQESGYGFTRTALNANNLFGFKVPAKGSPGGRGKYTLVCQPKDDPGKSYIAFRDYEDAVIYVAERLSSSPRYGKITEEYASIPMNKRTNEDIVNWVHRIAKAGYNCCPDKYKKQITRMMNDPLSPGDSESEHALYPLSIQSK